MKRFTPLYRAEAGEDKLCFEIGIFFLLTFELARVSRRLASLFEDQEEGEEEEMDTSLRYSSDAKSLRIRAKQKFPVDSKTLIQAHGELDTRIGAPNYLSLIIRRFYPELSASMGVGIQSDKLNKLGYFIRGKKAISITSNGSMGINIKGRCDTDKEFRERNPKGAVELVWNILDFQMDQDVRIKVGYEISEKVPYFQVRENNWTLNADVNGKWNIRFDL